MATYRPSFVDVSGLTAGINRGLELAAMEKRRQDALAEQSVNEYLKNYRPDKLRDNDIASFTGAFNDYKQAALMYSKMNRGGAKPEKLSQAKLMMDKSLNNLNSIYTNSSSAANKMAEYADYIKRARLSGLAIPKEINDNYNLLLSTPIDNIDVNKIRSAYDYELIPKKPNEDALNDKFAMLGAIPKVSEEADPYEITKFGKTPITGIIRTKTSKMPVQPTIRAVELAMAEDNAITNMANKLYESFKLNPDPYIQDIKSVIPDIAEDAVTPAILYSMKYIRPKVIEQKRDASGASIQVQSAKSAEDKAYRDALLRISQQRLALQQERDQDQKRGQIDPVKTISDFEKSQKFKDAKATGELVEVSDVKGFSGLPKFRFENANVEYIKYDPKQGKYLLKTTAPSDKTGRYLSSQELKNILIQGTRGATNKPIAGDDIIPSLEELESVGYKPDSELMKVLQDIDFGGD